MNFSIADENPSSLAELPPEKLKEMEFVLEVELMTQRRVGAKVAAQLTQDRLYQVRRHLKRNTLATWLLKGWRVVS